MAATATIAVAPGVWGSPVAGQALNFYATITNTGANNATLNSCSVSCQQPGVIFEQPNFLTSNVAPGVGNPVINAGASLPVRFSVTFPMPNAYGPSPQSYIAPAVVGIIPDPNPTFPVGSPFVLLVQAMLTDTAGSIVNAVGQWQSGVLAEMSPYPRAEGGALDFRQGSNFLGMIPGWP